MRKSIQLSHLYHMGKHQIRMDFPFDNELIGIVRGIDGRRWSQTNKCWYVENTSDNLKKIFEVFKGKARVVEDELFKKKTGEQVQQNKELSEQEVEKKKDRQKKQYKNFKLCPKEFIEKLIVKRYAENTLKVYKSLFTDFINYFPDKEIDQHYRRRNKGLYVIFSG